MASVHAKQMSVPSLHEKVQEVAGPMCTRRSVGRREQAELDTHLLDLLSHEGGQSIHLGDPFTQTA